jgi:hypothetical protein
LPLFGHRERKKGRKEAQGPKTQDEINWDIRYNVRGMFLAFVKFHNDAVDAEKKASEQQKRVKD